MASALPAFSILTWNILHGGGAGRTPEIILALLSHAPDLIVLSEFRGARGAQIKAALACNGWAHQARSTRDDTSNGLLVASRSPLEVLPAPVLPPLSHKWLEVHAPALDLCLLALHIPDDSAPTARRTLWQLAADSAKRHSARRAALVGDLNTGRRGIDSEKGGFSCEAMIGRLTAAGFRDVWRQTHPGEREFSWFGARGEARRIDHIFASTPLAATLQTSAYSQVERAGGLSDHAALSARFSAAGGPPGAPAPRDATPIEGLFSGRSSRDG